MFETGEWTAADVAAVLANPFYAIQFSIDICAMEGPLLGCEAVWTRNNEVLIGKLGASEWLRMLLRSLQGLEGEPAGPQYPADVWMQINPATAVRIHRRFADPHPAAMPEIEWIDNNVRLITDELGVAAYLQSLLAILRGATLLPDGRFFGFSGISPAQITQHRQG